MSFDFGEYRVLACDLVGCPEGIPAAEAKQRTAISRAYYAAYNHARQVLHGKRYAQRTIWVPAGTEGHQEVVRILGDLPEPGPTTAGFLKVMRGRRNAADYKPVYKPKHSRGLAADAKHATSHAKEVIANVDKLAATELK